MLTTGAAFAIQYAVPNFLHYDLRAGATPRHLYLILIYVHAMLAAAPLHWLLAPEYHDLR